MIDWGFDHLGGKSLRLLNMAHMLRTNSYEQFCQAGSLLQKTILGVSHRRGQMEMKRYFILLYVFHSCANGRCDTICTVIFSTITITAIVDWTHNVVDQSEGTVAFSSVTN